MAQDIVARGLGARALSLITGSANSGGGDLHAFLMREADPYTFNTSNASTAPVNWAGSAAITPIASTTIPVIGKAVWLESITASMNVPCLGQVQIAGDASGLFPGFVWQGWIGPNGVVIPVQQLFRGFQIATNALVSLSVRNVQDASPTTVNLFGGMSGQGWKLTDDFSFNAPKRVLFVGDSILNGTGPTKTANMWPFLVRDHLRALGSNARVVLKSASSSTSTHHEGWRAAGYHDVDDPDLIVYAVGANDAITGAATGTYTTNITAFWTWASKRYPNARVVICGVTPLENNTSETNAAALRSAASGYVTSVNDARLKYINLGAAFDRTSGTTNYATSDTAGSRVHPNDTGHAAVASAFNTAWDALGVSL